MKLGAQLYTLRPFTQNEADLRMTFAKLHTMGYENVQLSGAAYFPPEVLKEVSEENSLPIVCTHTPFARIKDETERVIEEHKIFGCPVIGLGAMPAEYHGSLEGLKAFLKDMEAPVQKILDAGLNFAYHNHAFEFKPFADGGNAFDPMLELLPHWQFIMDTYWIEFAGRSATDYIRKIGGKRLPNIHFKDMAKDEARSICACGNGVLDFGRIYEVCLEVGVKNVLVEQDNAPDAPDPFEEMAISYRHLSPIVK